MKKFIAALVSMALVASFTASAIAQTATDTAVKPAAAKIDDLGLKNSTLPADVQAALGLKGAQKEKVEATNAKTNKLIAKYKEELKALGPHGHHAPGEECPHHALGAKMRDAYVDYHKSLGSILNADQKTKVKSLMAIKEEEAKKAASVKN